MAEELEALKPCPFCGGSDLRVSTYDVQPDDYHSGYVNCDECDAQGRGALTLDGWLSSKSEAHTAAIAAWNTRATPSPSTDTLEGVTQEDREIAADIWRDYIAKTGEVLVERHMRSGGLDDTLPSILAAYRINSIRRYLHD